MKILIYFFYSEISHMTLEDINFQSIGDTSALPFSSRKASSSSDNEKAETSADSVQHVDVMPQS